jgi:hypothetical protein
MADFESPFLNWTDNEICDWMQSHPHPDFAMKTFTILDQNAVDYGLSRIGYISEEDPNDQMLWADSFADLVVRVPIEVGTTGWHTGDEIGIGNVYNRKAIQQEKAMSQQWHSRRIE